MEVTVVLGFCFIFFFLEGEGGKVKFMKESENCQFSFF